MFVLYLFFHILVNHFYSNILFLMSAAFHKCFILSCRQDASDLSGPIQRYCYTSFIIFLSFPLFLLLFPSASSSMSHAVYLQASGQTLTTSTGILASTLEWCWRRCLGGNAEGQEEDERKWRVERERERNKGGKKREIGKGRCDAAQIYGRGGSLN